MMGMKVKPSALREIIEEIDEGGSGLLEFGEFCQLAAKFLVEEDEEALKKELKEAFRIYDKDCMGFISTDTLKEILRELDNKLTEDDINNIIEEVDEDGSGTLDFGVHGDDGWLEIFRKGSTWWQKIFMSSILMPENIYVIINFDDSKYLRHHQF